MLNLGVFILSHGFNTMDRRLQRLLRYAVLVLASAFVEEAALKSYTSSQAL
jgi:hypothetical protein